MSQFAIRGLTLSIDYGDKDFGHGSSRRATVSAFVPDDVPGVPLADADSVVTDGMELYLTAWQTVMQSRVNTGDLNAEQYQKQTAIFLRRMKRVQALYSQMRGMNDDQLKTLLTQIKEKDKSDDRTQYAE